MLSLFFCQINSADIVTGKTIPQKSNLFLYRTLWYIVLTEVALKCLRWHFCSFIFCHRAAAGLWSHDFKSYLEISWPEMMLQNVPYQIPFLTPWLLQSRDQWPLRLMTPSLLQEWRSRQLLQITGRRLRSFRALGLLSLVSHMNFYLCSQIKWSFNYKFPLHLSNFIL